MQLWMTAPIFSSLCIVSSSNCEVKLWKLLEKKIETFAWTTKYEHVVLTAAGAGWLLPTLSTTRVSTLDIISIIEMLL